MGSTCHKTNHIYKLIIAIIQINSVIASNNSYSTKFNLPSAIVPTKYFLELTTNIHENLLPYNGSVTIELKIREPTDKIVLNAQQIGLSDLILTSFNSSLKLDNSEIQYELDKEKEHLVIYWPSTTLKLLPGELYVLRIGFFGNIRDNNETVGFVRKTYFDDKDIPIPIAATHFEWRNAHSVFPCFDEPAFKARFILSITHGSNYSAVSNMPVDGKPISILGSDGKNMTTTKFLETPLMSTYLFAFAITNFNRTTISVDGVEYGFLFPANCKNNGSQIFQNAIKTVKVLESYLGIKYPLPKLDHIEIENLYGNAMENWGLLTFRINQTLSSQNNFGQDGLLSRINTHNHEIAHQWFGNLVTPASPATMWIKEGLSTYFSHLSADWVYPEKKFFEYFVITQLYRLTIHHINHPLMPTNPEDVIHITKEPENILPYILGGTLMRMLAHSIGQANFQKGISRFLSKFQYSVADDNDLFGTLQEALDQTSLHLFQNNQSIINVMYTWTHNRGIPTITVTRNYNTGTITIRQESNGDRIEEKWWIPLNFATATDPNFDKTTPDYIMPPQSEVILNLKDFNISLSNRDWLIVNKQQIGTYFVAYDEINLKLIANALNTNYHAIHLHNRASILRDLFATRGKKSNSIELILEILQYLKFEPESLPWSQAIDLINHIITNLRGLESSKRFTAFIYDIFIERFNNKYQSGGASNLTSTDMIIEKQMKILNGMIKAKPCQTYTTDFPKEFFFGEVDQTKLPCQSSLCEGIRNASAQEIRALFSRMIDLEYETEEYFLFEDSLRCINSEEHVNVLYEIFFEEEGSTPIVDYGNFKYFIFMHLGLTNDFCRNTFMRLDQGKKFDKILVDYFSEKISARKDFVKRFEDNMNAWLDKYEKRNGLLETDVSQISLE